MDPVPRDVGAADSFAQMAQEATELDHLHEVEHRGST
jgi:hypothetical protein